MFVSTNTHNKKIGMKKRFCTTLLCFFRSAIHDKLKIIAEESEIFITMIHTLDITPKTKNRTKMHELSHPLQIQSQCSCLCRCKQLFINYN